MLPAKFQVREEFTVTVVTAKEVVKDQAPYVTLKTYSVL
jgi:hypothetical protein